MILKKEFYFIRHGQTDYNKSKLKADHEDVSLNAEGFKQAQEIEPLIAKLSIKTICCSPLRRAIETKRIISPRLNAIHYEMSSLEECSFQIWNDMTFHGTRALYCKEDHVRKFLKKVQRGVNEALALEGPALLVAHGGTHWALCCLMGIADYHWSIDNCLPVHFFVDEARQWKARRL